MLRWLSFDFLSVQGSDTQDRVGGTEEHDIYETRHVNVHGKSICWVPKRHYETEELEPYRLVGDVEMDDLLNLRLPDVNLHGRFQDTIRICAHYYHTSKSSHETATSNPSSSDYLPLVKFYSHYHDHIPSWVDWDQIQRGMDVFVRYSPVAGISLFYLSLVPGFSIPKIAEVLKRTKYLTPPSTAQQVSNRLMDTGGFLNSAMGGGTRTDNNADNNTDSGYIPAQALRPGGKAWTLALQVRALHGKVRQSILQTNGTRQWDTKEYGIPINQEDMAATLLAFSVNVILGFEVIAGVPMSDQQQMDYLALWRYIGWLLGIDTVEAYDDDGIPKQSSNGWKNSEGKLDPLDPCGTRVTGRTQDSSIIHSKALLESIISHLMRPDESSVIISRHLLSIGQFGDPKIEKTKSSEVSFSFLRRAFFCRIMIGAPLADALMLPKIERGMKVGVALKMLFAKWFVFGVLIVLRIYTLLTVHSTSFHEWAVTRHLRMMAGFQSIWEKSHDERMKMSKFAKPPNANESIRGGDKKESSCPFALVMPPLVTHVKLD